jgi:hypothetical protein
MQRETREFAMLRSTLVLTVAVFVALGAMMFPQGSAQAVHRGVRVHDSHGDYCMVVGRDARGNIVVEIFDCDD